jgi:hypothetical protein
MLQRARPRDSLFVAMSNYYYDEKDEYLRTLSDVRLAGHDLTAFLKFGLEGIAKQCSRLLAEVRTHISKSLFRDVMAQLYGRLTSARKRALADRQLQILTLLLDADEPIELWDLYGRLSKHYAGMKVPVRAFLRDMTHVKQLKAIRLAPSGDNEVLVSVRLEWPTEITDTEFYKAIGNLPKAKTSLLLAPTD